VEEDETRGRKKTNRKQRTMQSEGVAAGGWAKLESGPDRGGVVEGRQIVRYVDRQVRRQKNKSKQTECSRIEDKRRRREEKRREEKRGKEGRKRVQREEIAKKRRQTHGAIQLHTYIQSTDPWLPAGLAVPSLTLSLHLSLSLLFYSLLWSTPCMY
jgi:hypothetical protein